MGDHTASPDSTVSRVRAVIDPELDVIHLSGQGASMALDIDNARELRDSLTNHINLMEAEANNPLNRYRVDIRERMQQLQHAGRNWQQAQRQAIDEITAGEQLIRCDRCSVYTGEPRVGEREGEIAICGICATPAIGTATVEMGRVIPPYDESRIIPGNSGPGGYQGGRP